MYLIKDITFHLMAYCDKLNLLQPQHRKCVKLRHFTEEKLKLFYGNYRSLCHLLKIVGSFLLLDVQMMTYSVSFLYNGIRLNF